MNKLQYGLMIVAAIVAVTASYLEFTTGGEWIWPMLCVVWIFNTGVSQSHINSLKVKQNELLKIIDNYISDNTV